MDWISELPAFMTAPLVLGVLEFPFSLLQLLLELVLPVVAIGLGVWFAYRVIKKLLEEARLTDVPKQTAIRWTRRFARLGWFLSAVLLAGRLFGAEMARWIGLGLRALTQPFFTSGNTSISVVTLLLVIPVFYFAGWVSQMARRSAEQSVVRRLNLDPASTFSVLTVIRFTVMVVTVVIGLSVIGINLSSLAVLFGVLGIGVGFGLQDVVANSFAGLIIIFTRPIKEGDRILVGEIEGTVQQIKFIHTVVNTVLNETLIIPNSEITGNSMHNYSYDDISILLCNTVQVSYASDLDFVGEVLTEVGSRNPYAVPDESPRYRVVSFDDSGITVRLCTWIRDARERIPASSWCNPEIWRAFKKNGVEIPFPQVDLHVRSSAIGNAGVIDTGTAATPSIGITSRTPDAEGADEETEARNENATGTTNADASAGVNPSGRSVPEDR